MMKTQHHKNLFAFILIAVATFFVSDANAQTPAIEWQKNFGGSYEDFGSSVQQTIDGGFIVAGFSVSTNGNVSGNHGGFDSWIVKLDAAGNLAWQKSLGGSSEDYGTFVQQTTDGGFVVAGYSYSNDGDVSGNHGGYDYWIVKLGTSGNLVWQKSFGGSEDEGALSVQQTTDGGFIVAGFSQSSDGDVSGNHGGNDDWVLKLDAAGNLVWQKSLGGSGNDYAIAIQQTTDGGFVVAGYSDSNDGDVSVNQGGLDYWIVKLDTAGNLIWQKSLGGSDIDLSNYVQQTSDGGFIVAGSSLSNDGDVSGNHGGLIYGDYWIVKLDSAGDLLWQKSFGGSNEDDGTFILQTIDGGFFVAGYSDSNDGDVSGNHGSWDIWILQLDADGNLAWQRDLGGSGEDYGASVQQTTDGGFILAGSSGSADGDVTYNHGIFDYWIVKLTSDTATSIPSLSNSFISEYPNPASDKITVSFSSSEKKKIQIINILGQIVFTEEINSAKKEIDVSEFPAGIYEVIAQTFTQKVEKKFLKQ
ncbi:MAG TPA: T9SS type A sorting domain-containing protein [Chitinophagales bacterium]|nr:T9SS type A sorting domain-containing protein [Chitinophagales bacterium]